MLDVTIRNDLENICSAFNREQLKDKNILIIGGAGFLGSWLCDTLIKLESNIVCIDNLSSGAFDNISHLKKLSRFEFREANVEELENVINDENFEFILHLASRAAPEDYQIHALETLKANSIGTLNALEAARKRNSSFLFTSTSEIYGDAQIIPTPESYWGNVNPIGVRSPYDESKRFSEALCKAYERKYGVDTRIVRIFNTFGPRLRPEGQYGRAMSRFILQAADGKDITVYGDGSQTRSFCYVTDTITAIISMMVNERARGEVLNIGGPEEISMLELANMIKTLMNSKSKIEFCPLPPDDPHRRRPDISKAERMLGWQPKIPLDEGLKRTISWFLRNRKIGGTIS